MEAKRLAGLEPAPVFGYFEEICAIPHGSRNTKRISDYLVNFAILPFSHSQQQFHYELVLVFLFLLHYLLYTVETFQNSTFHKVHT